MILKRRKRERMGLREEPQYRNARYLKHVRGFQCCIAGKNGHVCEGKIEAMHVRSGTDGGMAVKPSDFWTIPGCSAAHREQHQIGEPAFERKYGISMKAIAERLWKHSRHYADYMRDRT